MARTRRFWAVRAKGRFLHVWPTFDQAQLHAQHPDGRMVAGYEIVRGTFVADERATANAKARSALSAPVSDAAGGAK